MLPNSLTRRTFLRGTGTAIALPWLESLPQLRGESKPAQPNQPPVRAAFLFFPNGVWRDAWIPKQTGTDFELPFSLMPLRDLRSDVLILSGLDKKHSHSGDGHYAKTANFLTGLKVIKTTGKNINVGGMSVDQFAADRIGKHTPLPSLELGIDPVISGIDSNVGYTRLYGSHISWRSATVPVAKEIHPRLVYERLFGSKTAQGRPDAARRRDDDRSLLDLTLDEAKRLRGQLSRDDQFKLDEYLDSIRAVERRIEFASKPDSRPKPTSPRPTVPDIQPALPSDFREHVRLMLDLMVLAFWSDSTRVLSFMFANDVSGRNFSFLDGVKAGHHDVSHHSNRKDLIEQYQCIVRWHVGEFAYLLGRLKAIPEGTGTLLQHCLILFGSSMSDGNGHDPSNLPILIGGQGGGLKTGRHLAYPKNTPLCNWYVSMLERLGTPVQSFGDSTGPLANLG